MTFPELASAVNDRGPPPSLVPQPKCGVQLCTLWLELCGPITTTCVGPFSHELNVFYTSIPFKGHRFVTGLTKSDQPRIFFSFLFVISSLALLSFSILSLAPFCGLDVQIRQNLAEEPAHARII